MILSNALYSIIFFKIDSRVSLDNKMYFLEMLVLCRLNTKPGQEAPLNRSR